MEFSTEKCPMLIIKGVKTKTTERIELPNQERLRRIGEKEK